MSPISPDITDIFRMEFKLPFPTLQDLAVLEIAHSLMDLEVSHESFAVNRPEYLRESLSKVDKLALPEKQKCRIREVLKGTHDHLHNWFRYRSCNLYTHYGGSPKLQFDVHGCVDEERMSRSFLQKCYLDERYDNDMLALQHLLRVASYYVFLPDIHKILLKILKLRAKDSVVPQLKGPEYKIVYEGQLQLVYRFVDQQGTPMSFNIHYIDPCGEFSFNGVCSSRFCINLSCVYYNPELFQMHWNLLDPSKRMPFVRSLLIRISSRKLVRKVLQIVNVLDPASVECYFEDTAYDGMTKSLLFVCLECLLVWPYQELFLPALRLRKLKNWQPFELFIIIVNKLDMMAFREILMPLWEATPSTSMALLSSAMSVPGENCSYPNFKYTLRKLSQKSAPMYERVVADLNLPLACLQETQKRRHESSSSFISSIVKKFLRIFKTNLMKQSSNLFQLFRSTFS